MTRKKIHRDGRSTDDGAFEEFATKMALFLIGIGRSMHHQNTSAEMDCFVVYHSSFNPFAAAKNSSETDIPDENHGAEKTKEPKNGHFPDGSIEPQFQTTDPLLGTQRFSVVGESRLAACPSGFLDSIWSNASFSLSVTYRDPSN